MRFVFAGLLVCGAARADSAGPPFSPESPDHCVPDADAPTPVERLTAPAGSLWWATLPLVEDIDATFPATPSVVIDSSGAAADIAPIVVGASVALEVPAGAADGDVFSLSFEEGELPPIAFTVGAAPAVASTASIASVTARELRARRCSCDDGERVIAADIAISGGPAVVEYGDSADTLFLGGFLFDTGDTSIVIDTSAFFPGLGQPQSIKLHVVLEDPETLAVLDTKDVDLAVDGLKDAPLDPAIPHCKNGCGCAASTSQAPLWTSAVAAALAAAFGFMLKRRATRSA